MTSKTHNKRNAIEHKCWECMGKYSDGRVDCRVTACPLYAWMPYRELEPKLDWIEYSPRKVGEQPYTVKTENQMRAVIGRRNQSRAESDADTETNQSLLSGQVP